jgi:hypothetical protein
MQKFFINEQEVDEEEFFAELKANVRAMIDEDLNYYLVSLSDNPVHFFDVGNFSFTAIDIYKMLDGEAQEEIKEHFFMQIYDETLDQINERFEVYMNLGDGGMSFEVKEVDE